MIRNPSVEGDTPYKSSTSPDEMFAQDVTNDIKSKLVTNIMDQMHYNTWENILDIFYKRKSLLDAREIDESCTCNARND